ncbi:hypothetical protein N9W06_02935 [Candidatus Marinimicrobia bacterium]|nr:hypothetical protein [Candidatus Neomarinimicrobiota bacterium]MDC3333911.1 hypothetical protein [Candidatus Neomarinimicrobiota bacterium]|tara:strand:- start:2683 stop:3393 length:711 start_codon:yes stop_codon:yes gene_type:complete
MQTKERILFFILPSFAICAFIIFVIIGALSYKGGNNLDQNSIGYSFANNYLSDLGRLKSVAGHVNSVPFYCFNGGLIMLSVVFSLYFSFLPSLYDESINVQNISRVGSIFGFLASLCFAGVAFTPADLLLEPHIFFADWLFRLMNLSIIFYAISYVIMEKKYFIFSFIFGLVALFVSAHIILSDFGLAKFFNEPHTVRVLSQKAASIALLISVPLMTIYNRQRLKSGPVVLKILSL